jgi:hypothetical protein
MNMRVEGRFTKTNSQHLSKLKENELFHRRIISLY